MRRMGYIFIAILPLLLSGCSNCRLTVANASDLPVTDVYLSSGDKVIYRATSIVAHGTGTYRRIQPALPETVTLKWRSATGKHEEMPIKSGKKLPKRYKGRLIYQINQDNSAKLFKIEDEPGARSLIPWGFSEKFDGAVNVPGFNSQP